MNQITIEFVKLEGIHSGENITNILFEILANYKSLNKIYFIFNNYFNYYNLLINLFLFYLDLSNYN